MACCQPTTVRYMRISIQLFPVHVCMCVSSSQPAPVQPASGRCCACRTPTDASADYRRHPKSSRTEMGRRPGRPKLCPTDGQSPTGIIARCAGLASRRLPGQSVSHWRTDPSLVDGPPSTTPDHQPTATLVHDFPSRLQQFRAR